MKTSVIEVHDMLSVLSVDEVEKRINEVPGVESVTVNFAAANATVRYDETRLEIADVKSAVRQRGFEVAAPDTPAPDNPAPAGDVPQGKAAQSATPESPPAESPAAPSPTSDASKPPDASAAP
jgi:Cu2+-exporting ATPase